MRKKANREPRESSLASGWTVEADPTAAPAEQAVNRGEETVDRDESAAGRGERTGAPADHLMDAEATEGTPALDGEEAAATQLSNGALVLLGVIGGLYLLYTWVWFSWASYYSQVNSAVAEGSGVIGAVLQQIVFWAAPLAPALWFLSAFALNRAASTWKLALWLIIGAVVLVPLPALVIGGAA